MHDRTRRNLCRLAFLLFCVLPTACVLVLILHRHSSFYRSATTRHWEQALFQRLGLITTIDRVWRSERHVISLEGVKLIDPETRQQIARIRVLELAQRDHGQVLWASQPEIADGQFLRVWEVLHERLLRGPPLDSEVRFLAGEVTLLGDNGQTFTNVECLIEQHETGAQVLLDFRVAGAEEQSTAQLRIMRNRQLSPPATGWQLRTGSTSLPCSMFTAYLPVLESLGPSCRFAGTASADRSTNRWNGEFVGRFTQVDLDGLIAPFPHKLSGTAELVFQRARFQDGRLLEAAGAVRADGGVISRSLVEALGNALQLDGPGIAATDPRLLLEYQQLAFGYELVATKLRLSGTCQNAPIGTVLLGKTGPLLTDSGTDSIPAVALARALSPSSEFLVPATKETGLLLDALPVPTGSSATTRQATRPNVTVRLREE